MRLRHATLAIGVLTLFASTGHAQITGVQSTFTSGTLPGDGGVVTGGYYVGPYTGTIKLGATTIPVVFNCVDFFHDVYVGESWTSTLVNLGTGDGIGATDATSDTRLYGNVTVNSQSFSALDVYRAAAYLTSLYPAKPSTNVSGTIAIQTEIWEMTSLFYPQVQGESSDFKTATTTTDGYSYTAPKTVAQLATDLFNYSHEQNFDYSQYWVVTSSSPNSDLASSPQEFIIHQTISTPEPGTLALLGSGMFGMVGGGFFRRRRSKAKETATSV